MNSNLSKTTESSRNNYGDFQNKLPREGYSKPEKIPDFNDPEFLGDRAWDWAIFITKARYNDRRGTFETDNKITTHQIRRYYSEIKSIERSLGDEPDLTLWNNAYPKIKLLIAKATYDCKRSMSRLPNEFADFIMKAVKAVPSDLSNGYDAFKKVCLLFEAVVGYSSQYTRE